MLELLLRPIVRLALVEAAPGIFTCGVCETAVEDAAASVIAHYWDEHRDLTTTAAITAGVVVVFLGARGGAALRRS